MLLFILPINNKVYGIVIWSNICKSLSENLQRDIYFFCSMQLKYEMYSWNIYYKWYVHVAKSINL